MKTNFKIPTENMNVLLFKLPNTIYNVVFSIAPAQFAPLSVWQTISAPFRSAWLHGPYVFHASSDVQILNEQKKGHNKNEHTT